ncbi:hypothetical protein [Pimelobacter simplex]|uniref:hypothetical protein n=1 Tax=Nocardioides simplex TaxID=2045 RepID=UPI00214F9CDD|nr:hypothetical protein [Pimelobacter simplex]UUW88609.1 hypothetical protein M0M43_23135 [Pimelobacter simplex]UUW98114.1 hypothetical protein M0M48_11785 [Pimelobacter simplex]
MGLFERSAAVKAKRIGACARYVDEDVQRVDLKVMSTDGESALIDLSLDQTPELVIGLTNA